jgi:hypothetical protein
MSVDNPSIIDIGTLIVTAFVGAVAAVIAFLTYLQGKYREKNDFLINIIRMLDDNANRNDKEKKKYPGVKLPIKDVEECQN